VKSNLFYKNLPKVYPFCHQTYAFWISIFLPYNHKLQLFSSTKAISHKTKCGKALMGIRRAMLPSFGAHGPAFVITS